MPLTDADWAEVLEHARRRVKEAGFGDLDTRITLDFQSTENASADFMRYLTGIISGVKERSLTGYDRALETLRSAILTENGGPIEGIEVDFIGRDERLYATDRIDLQQTEDLTSLLRELSALYSYLSKNGVTM